MARTEQDQHDLEEKVDAIELHDKTEEEVDRIVKGLSPEGIALRRARKNVRYQLYRLRSSFLGECKDTSEPGLKEMFEAMEMFGGWKNFAETWDVAMDDPYRIVHRVYSVQEEWDAVMKAKFPILHPGGRVEYPDVTVKAKVEAEEKLQAEELERKKTAKKKQEAAVSQVGNIGVVKISKKKKK